MRRIQDLAVSARSGAMSPTALGAVADELDQLQGELGDLANTQHLGRSLFGGFGSAAVSNAGGSWQYVGDSGSVDRRLGPNLTLGVNVLGSTVFGFAAGPGQDVFSSIGRLSAAVRAGNGAGIDAAQGELAVHAQTISQQLGVVGARTNRVEAAQQAAQDSTLNLQTVRSGVEDADIAETILRLNQAQTGYQAALGAAAKANMPSLAEFLR